MSRRSNTLRHFDPSFQKSRRSRGSIIYRFYTLFYGAWIFTIWCSASLIVYGDRLFALGMELPEDTFVNIHGYDEVGETYGMFLTTEIFAIALTSYEVRFMK